MKNSIIIFSLLLLVSFSSCKNDAKQEKIKDTKSTAVTEEVVSNKLGNATNVYWGDTHFHTAISGDAFGGGTRLTPEQSYRLAIGEKITSNTGQDVQLKRPLDFLAITDHAEGFGWFNELAKGNPKVLDDPKAKEWYALLQQGKEGANKLAVAIPYALSTNTLPKTATDPKIVIPQFTTSWKAFTATAEKYNDPGTFTTIIAYEWTSVPTGNNLHRNIMFRDNKDKTDQILPFSALQSEDPEKLWEFLNNYEQKTGGRALAIPHNGNLSGGLMFSPNDFNGNPIDATYAANRAKWEPLYEIMQIKGAGETHPLLSLDDEFANYGITGWDNGNLTLDVLETQEQRRYQHARQALVDGIKFESELGINPFKFGLVAATDTHTSLVSGDEDNWWGKFPNTEQSPDRIAEIAKKYNGVTRYGWHYLAGGYTAIWATENTRTALWDAMERKETYGTTGTRIKLRVFGGYDFTKSDINNENYATIGYDKGIAMGGDLPHSKKAPQLMIHAVKDPNWANLDRIQVIKGWVENGKGKEKIYDVAWSGNREIDKNGKLPAVGNTVNLKDATYANTIGATELKTIWKDPDFKPSQHAFYYVRVLEIPSPTWQLYDMVKYNLKDVSKDVPLTQQERAWSSPIWYTPSK